MIELDTTFISCLKIHCGDCKEITPESKCHRFNKPLDLGGIGGYLRLQICIDEEWRHQDRKPAQTYSEGREP
jgi:hypothetical protein